MNERATTPPRRVTERTKHLLRRTLGAFDDNWIHVSGDYVESLVALARRGRDAGDLSSALIEVMRGDNEFHLRVVPPFTLCLKYHCPDVIDDDAIRQSEQLLLAAMNSPDPQTVAEACGSLTTEVALTSAVALKLRQLVGAEDLKVAVSASAALVAQAEAEVVPADALAKLRQGIRSRHLGTKIISAVAFVEMAVDVPGSEQVIESEFKDLPQGGRVRVLAAMISAPAGVQRYVPLCLSVLRSRKEDPTVRMFAARALGSIAGQKTSIREMTRKRVVEQMIACAQAEDCPWELYSGVAQGLQTLGLLGLLRDRSIALLEHPEMGTRGTAVRVLNELGPDAADALPHLVKRLREETDVEVLQYVGGALGRMGPTGIPKLVEALGDSDVLRTEVAVRAIGQTGDEGVRTLSRLMLTIDDDRMQQLLATVLFGMGWKAAPAVKGLAYVIDGSDNPEAALYAAMAIFNSGKAAVPVLETLVRRVADFDADLDPAANWCRLTLSRLRLDALPVLDREAALADGRRRERLLALIADFSPGLDPKTAYLDRTAESVVRNFVSIIEFLLEAERDGTLPPSKKKLAAALQNGGRKLVGKTAKRRDKWTDTAIDRTLDEIEEKRGGEPTVARGREAGVVRPTAAGKAAFEEARRYLDMLELRRGFTF